MTRDLWFKYYDALPDLVQEYFLDQRCVDQEDAAQKELAYDADAWERVMDVVWDALFLRLPQATVRDRLRALAGDRKPDDVERSVLFNILLPVGDLLPWDVETRLQELGVSLVDMQPVPRISLRPVSYGAAVRRIAAQAKIGLLSEEIIRRLRDLVVSFIKGVRTIEQVKEQLQRQQRDGGIGLTRAQTEIFTTAMTEFIKNTQIMSEQDYAEWFRAEQNRVVTEEQEQTVGEGGEDGAPGEVRIGARTLDRMSALEVAVDQTVALVGDLGFDEYMGKRLRNLISTRMRDVRSAIQVRQMLEREQKVGGLGLPPDDAERVADLIEKSYQNHRAQIGEEEKKMIEEVQGEQKTKIEERKQRESEEHAQWYAEKVKTAKAQEQVKQNVLSAMKLQAAPPVPGMIPTVDAIRPPAARLVGLTEELGGITLAEFRRMAKDPTQAAEKILQKFEALRNESFDRWTEGIRMWRESPLQQQYLRLVAESFAVGKPVVQVAEEKRLKDPSLASPEELAAIIELNSRIQL